LNDVETAMTTNVQELSPTTLAVTGMTCDGCARTVERVLSRVPGVSSAKVDFDLGRAIVSGSTAPSELITAIENAGYGATEAGATKGQTDEHRRSGCC
jgi:copper chaperone CopZ